MGHQSMLIPPGSSVSLNDLSPDNPTFPQRSTDRLLTFGRWYRNVSPEPRWSLVECGLESHDWAKILNWASQWAAPTVPPSRSLQSGILLLLVGTAVARNQEDDVLWSRVAACCSSTLRYSWFGCGEYPLSECRDSLRDACHILGLRNQLHLRGKMHYWRTITLQFGFNARVAQRQLPIWLAGYVIPETVRTLLTLGEENYSGSFDSFWRALGLAASGNISAEVDAQIASSPWCPPESRALITSGLLHTRATKSPALLGRIEDEERNPTIFATPRLGDSEFILSLSRILPKELTMPGPGKFPLSLEGFGTTLINRDPNGALVLDNVLRLPISDVLQRPVREVRVKLPGLGLYRERFEFWDDSADVLLFAGSQGRRILDPNQAGRNMHGAFSLVVRPDLVVKMGKRYSCTKLDQKTGLSSGFLRDVVPA